MKSKMLLAGAAALGLAATSLGLNAAPTVTSDTARIATLEAQLGALRGEARRGVDRGAVENLFSTYMALHNAFRDPEIVPLWAKKGTAGVRAQYSNNGVYTDWDTIMAYHAQRPNPPGKLVVHYVTNPVIEVAADGQTAKGMWMMTGIESGLTAPEAAAGAPDFMYEKNVVVDGRKVWMHTVFAKYGVDFIKQDGVWKIWHFRCVEIARSPFGTGWIPFAGMAQNSPFPDDLMYFGENGKPVMMPRPNGPATHLGNTYRTDKGQTLDLKPPVPYRTFIETFAY